MNQPEKNTFSMQSLKAKLEISRKDRRFEQQIEEQKLERLKKQLQMLAASKNDSFRVA